MNIIVPLVSLLIIAAAFAVALQIVCTNHKHTVAASERQLALRNQEYTLLADRLFLKEKLPPSKFDVNEAHQDKVDDARVRDARRRASHSVSVATGVGPVDRVQNQLLSDHLSEQIKNKQSQTGSGPIA